MTLLRWILWALIFLSVASALLTVGISQRLLVNYPVVPDSIDLPQRLAMFREADRQAYSIYLLSNLISIGVFFLVSILGIALRPIARQGTGRDVMASLFVIGGAIALISQLVIVGTNQTAASGHCDCGYLEEELIAQAKALDLGYAIQSWLAIGGLAIVGLGASAAGWTVDVSSLWRWLSFTIGLMLIASAAFLIADQLVLSDLVAGVAGAIFVPLWAFMLLRALPQKSPS